MKEMLILKKALFLGLGFCKVLEIRKNDHELAYHTYAISEGINVEIAVAFTYCSSLGRMVGLLKHIPVTVKIATRKMVMKTIW